MERPKSGITTSWTSSPEGLILSFHDDTGRLAGSRTYRGAVLVSTEDRIWRSGRLHSVSTEWHDDDSREVSSYDETGRLVSSLKTKGKEIIAFNEYSYDQADRLVAETRETPGRLETVEYVYGPDDALKSETILVNGQRTLSRIYTDADEMLEEYFDRGSLFSRVLYKNGKKVRETIFSNGILVRERSF